MADIGWAIAQAKKGERVRRRMWNHSSTFLTIEPACDLKAKEFQSRTLQSLVENIGGEAHMRPMFVLANGEGIMTFAYEINVGDAMADDWELAG